MLSPSDNYINNIRADIQFWLEKNNGVLSSGKIDRVRDEWLNQEPVRTISHIHKIRQILSGANLTLEKDALDQARVLQEQLHFTATAITELTKEPNHLPILDAALEKIQSAIKENDKLLLDIGERKHARENPIPTPLSELNERVKALQIQRAAGGSTAVAGSGGTVIPATTARPYRTVQKPATEAAAPIVRELLLGVRNDISEALLGEKGSALVIVPAVFAVDVTRGSYSLNKAPLYILGEPVLKAVQAYREYCSKVGSLDCGYSLACLLCQSHFERHLAKGNELLTPFFASGEGTLFDVSVEDQMVTIALKIVLEGKRPTDGSRHHAILMKTELTFPLKDLEQAAEIVRRVRTSPRGGSERSSNALTEGIVLPSIQAVDSISSPIATAELGCDLLRNF